MLLISGILLLAESLPAFAAKTATTTSLAATSGGNPVTTVASGSLVTLTATIAAGGSPVRPGVITFCDASVDSCTNSGVVGTAQLTSAGTAVLRFFPPVGAHQYKAVFAGNTASASSTSSAQTLTVTGSTTTTISSSGSAGNYTLTGTVVANSSAASPTGRVSFLDSTNSFALGIGTLGTGKTALSLPGVSPTPIIEPQPEFIAEGDFNGDGKLDLVTATPDYPGAPGPAPNGLSILLGNGNGSFTAGPASPLANTYVSFVAVGDFNNDGKADLAVVGGTTASQLIILLGNGDGTFAAVAAPPAVPVGACCLAVGDFNGDGNLDLAVANGQDTVTILLGDGTGAFTAAPSSPQVGSPFFIVAADFNDDGKVDLAVANSDSTVTILLGKGDGTFTTSNPLSLSGAPDSAPGDAIAVGDFNGDGKPDLAVETLEVLPPKVPGGPPNPVMSVNVFLGNGDGTFTVAPVISVPGGTNGYSIAVADFNSDGKTDLVTYDDAQLGVYISNGDGTFTLSTSTAGSTTSPNWDTLVVGDFNGDGIPDLSLADSDLSTALIVPVQSIASSTATLTGVSIPGTGNHGVTAAYGGNSAFGSSTSSAIQLAATQVVTALDLASSVGSSIYGQQLTLTATLQPYSDQSLATNGESVTFSSGGSTLGTATLSAGVAVLNVSSLPVGTDIVTATYAGDSTFAPATSSAVSIVVSTPVAVNLTVSPATGVVSNQTVTLTATTATTVPGGAWWITQDGTDCAANGLVCGAYSNAGNGGLIISTSPLSAGTHTFYAYYSATPPPGNQLPPNAARAAITVAQATPTASATTLSVTSAGNRVSTVPAGSEITLTAAVKVNGSPVTSGQILFCNAAAPHCTDINLVGTAQLTPAGIATLNFYPGLGSHSYSAEFIGIPNGSTPYGASMSSAASLNVTGLTPTSTTITASGTPGDLTLTATIVGSKLTTFPTGTVSFVDNSKSNAILGTAPLGPGTLGLSFSNPANPATGQNPVFVATGDFNGDGKLDLAVVNVGTNALTILLGNGDGTFTATASSPATGNAPNSIAVGDFNGDGKLDLAVANVGANSVTVLLGNGDGTFTEAALVPASFNSPDAITAGDFNGDGKLDLAVANNGTNTVTILLGNGDGTFTATASSPATGNIPDAIVASDLNGDGKLDLAVANSRSNTVTILLGNGDGTFTATASSPATGNSPNSIAVGDFNEDGIPDLAVEDGEGNAVTILLGNGDGTFTATASSPATGNGPTSIAVGDFNGDGKPDLAVANFLSNTVTILLGNGDGTFNPTGSSPATGVYPVSLAVGDFNGDGLPDIAVENDNSNTVTILSTSLTETATATVTGISVSGAGAHALDANYSGDSLFAGSVSPTITINQPQTTPTISWPTPAPVVQGTALSNAQLDATASVDGTFAYNPPLGSILDAGTHTLSVTFTPTDTTNYTTATASVSLTVNPAVPAATLAPTTLAFSGQTVGSTSTAQTVTLTNSGTAALNIKSIAASGDFAQTNNCGSSVGTGGSCAISVTFTPTASGTRTGSVTITDNASGSQQVVSLTGAGSTVTVSSGSTSLSVSSAGGSTTAIVQLASADGFSGTVNLTCAVSYQGAGTPTDSPACSLNPAQAQVTSGSTVTTTLTITTTAATSAHLDNKFLRLGGGTLAALFFFVAVPRRRLRGLFMLVLLCLAAVSFAVGCGGGGKSANNTKNTPSNPGTTAGNYSITVTATSGSASAKLTLPLSVQ